MAFEQFELASGVFGLPLRITTAKKRQRLTRSTTGRRRDLFGLGLFRRQGDLERSYEDSLLQRGESSGDRSGGLCELCSRGRHAATETFSNLILVDDGTLDYLVNQVNLRSAFVNVEAVKLSNSDLSKFPICGTSAAGQQLKNGNDRYGDLSPDDFVGTDGGSGRRTGIQSIEDIDEVSI